MNGCARIVLVSAFVLSLILPASTTMAAPPGPAAAPGQSADSGEATKRLPVPAPAPGHAPAAPSSNGSRALPPVQRAPGSLPPAQPGGPPSTGAGARASASIYGSGRPSPSLGLSGPQKVARYRDLIARSCASAGADAAILSALMEVEGSGEGAISPAGAMGLMQLMPDKFRPGDDPFDPATNLLRAAQHIRLLQDRWKAPHLVAAAYFGAIDGRGNVTGATDGNVSGHEYVARFQAAYQRYGGSAMNDSGPKPATGERGLASLDLGPQLQLGGSPELGTALPRWMSYAAVGLSARGRFGAGRYRMVPLPVL